MKAKVASLEDLRNKVEMKGQYLARNKQAELTKLKHLIAEIESLKDLDGNGSTT